MTTTSIKYVKKKSHSEFLIDLKNLNRNLNGIKRICFHKNLSSKLHFMMLDLKKNFFYPRHAHKDSDEIVFVIKGKLYICVWEEGINKKYKKVVLNSQNKFYLIPKNIFHKTLAVTNTCIYVEIKNGPYYKKNLMFR